MTNHQKLRQLPVKQLAKLLVKYCPDVDYYSRHYDYDDDYDCGNVRRVIKCDIIYVVHRHII